MGDFKELTYTNKSIRAFFFVFIFIFFLLAWDQKTSLWEDVKDPLHLLCHFGHHSSLHTHKGKFLHWRKPVTWHKGTLWTGSSACCAYEENLLYRCASGVRVPRKFDCWIITCHNSSSFTCKGTWKWWERDCKDNQKQDFCVILKGKVNIDSRQDVCT